eukprot:scaffold6708_cov134-Cylindrotheca_fusiformis.AAC.1
MVEIKNSDLAVVGKSFRGLFTAMESDLHVSRTIHCAEMRTKFARSHLDIPSMSNKRQKTMITIQYWPILARSSGLFRMCAEAGIPVTHLTSKDDMNAALFGVAESSNL